MQVSRKIWKKSIHKRDLIKPEKHAIKSINIKIVLEGKIVVNA
jgi:hypothetical protein